MVTLRNELICYRQHLEAVTSEDCNTYMLILFNTRGDVIMSAMAIVSRVCIRSSCTGYYDANRNNLPSTDLN